MYAAVSAHVLREEEGRLVGYASPESGPAPCLLRLFADDAPVAAARATRYSRAAFTKRVRLGWCGVELPGLAVAAALADRVEVRCGVSGRVLWARTGAPPAAARRRPRPAAPFPVERIVALSQAVDASPSLAEIAVFARGHLERHGINAFVEATYQTLLGRGIDRDGLRAWTEHPPGRDFVDALTTACTTSDEFLERRFPVIPGPFNAAFRYDLAPLG